MITDVLFALAVSAAPVSGVPGTPTSPGAPPYPGAPAAMGGVERPGATLTQASQEPEIAAAETALKTAEKRAREAQIEVSQRISAVQEARMGVELARAEVDLRRLKSAPKSSDGKTRIKAVETRISVLRSLIQDDLPAMRELQGQMLKAQMEDPAAATGLQAELMNRQRSIARKQLELEIATLRAAGGDPARIQAMERRLQDLKKQAPPAPPTGGPRDQGAGKNKKGKT